MTPAAAWFMLNLFLPSGTAQEATWGPSTGNILLWTTQDGCNAYARDYIAQQERAKTGMEYRWTCRRVGMGK